MPKAQSIEHILTISGRSEQLRAFRRIAYYSKKNPLDFYKILPVESYADQLFYEHSCLKTYGVNFPPNHVRMLKNEEDKLIYSFRTQGHCDLRFIHYSFPDLKFELFLPAEDKHIIIINEGFESDYMIAKPQNAIIPDEMSSFLKVIGSESLALLISDDLNDFNPDILPYDFVLHNKPVIAVPSCTRISRKTICIKANPLVLLRWLYAYGVKIKCFIGLVEQIHNTTFFELLSPVLLDESFYFADSIMEVSLRQGNMLANPDTTEFPNLNFSFKSPHQAEMPFDPGLLPRSNLDYTSDDLPPVFFEKEAIPVPNSIVPAFTPSLFSISRRPPMTEIINIGKIEVSLTNASVWDFESKFDCIVPYVPYKWDLDDFLPQGKQSEYILNLDWFLKRPFKKFLEEAFLEKWKFVGIAIDLEQDYMNAIKAIRKWNKKYPEKIHFFFLNPDRKEQISKLITAI